MLVDGHSDGFTWALPVGLLSSRATASVVSGVVGGLVTTGGKRVVVGAVVSRDGVWTDGVDEWDVAMLPSSLAH
jgi:hypothetical protein